MNNFKQNFTAFLRGRNFASGLLVAIILASVVFVNIICYTITEAFELYIYSPVKPNFEISDTFDEVFREAEKNGEKITVSFCMEEDDLKVHATGSYVYETAKKFAEKYDGFLNIRYINLITMYDEDGNDVSEALQKYKTDLNGKETPIVKGSVIFSSGEGNDENYRVVNDYATTAGYSDFYTLDSSGYATSYNGEEVFASIMNWVLTDEHPTAYFTVGHGETASQSLYTLLTCAGYYVDTINLRATDDYGDGVKEKSVAEKLAEAELIIISNPTTDFERRAEGASVNMDTEIDFLMDYAERGGSFFITLDPYISEKKLSTLYGFLKDYGISLKNSEHGERQTIQDMDNGITTDGFTLVADFADGRIPTEMENKINDNGRVILRDVSPLTLGGAAKPLLVTSESSVCYSNGEVTNRDGSYTIAAYSELESDKGKISKLFFIPTIYLTATDAMVTNGYANKDFIYSLFDVFYGLDDMPYGCNSIIFDNQVLENLTMGTARLYSILLLAIPTVLAVVGFGVRIRRKNR